MAISLKNVDDRLRVLENVISRKVYIAISDISKKVLVKKGNPYILNNDYLKTAKYIGFDYTTFDNYNINTINTCIVPLQYMHDGKIFYTKDTYANDQCQGLKLSLVDNTLTAEAHYYPLSGLSETTWITYLAIFE